MYEQMHGVDVLVGCRPAVDGEKAIFREIQSEICLWKCVLSSRNWTHVSLVDSMDYYFVIPKSVKPVPRQPA